MPKCRTERLLRSFFPSTILTLNNRVCIDHISCMYDNFLFLLDLAGALTTLSSNGAFASNSLIIWPKTVSKVAIIKTKSAAIAFFSSPRPFCFSFPSLLYMILELLTGLRNLPFDTFSLKWLQISLGCFSKNRRGIYIKNRFGIVGNSITYHRHYCKPVPFFIRFACNPIFKNACNNVVLIH